MKIFVVDQGLFNGKENDKWMESKGTNHHVSELNIFMKMGYELVKARQENIVSMNKNEQWRKMSWEFYWLTKWNAMRLQRKWDEGFIDWRSMDAMETLVSERFATARSDMH